MDELGQITLTQLAGIGMSILLTITLVAMWKIGIPLASEWWQRRREAKLSTDSRETATLERRLDAPTLRRAANQAPADLLPTLLVLLAIHARKNREELGREGKGTPGSCESLHISDKGLSKGQWRQLEAWVRGGKKGLTQAEIAGWMAKRDQTITEAVRTIEQRIQVEQQQAAVAQEVIDEQVKLQREVERVRALPRDPKLEQMTPLPT